MYLAFIRTILGAHPSVKCQKCPGAKGRYHPTKMKQRSPHRHGPEWDPYGNDKKARILVLISSYHCVRHCVSHMTSEWSPFIIILSDLGFMATCSGKQWPHMWFPRCVDIICSIASDCSFIHSECGAQ